MRLFDKRIISHFDYLLIIFVLPLIFISYHLIGETNERLANKQLVYYVLSIFAFLLVFILPIRKKIRTIPTLYWLGIILLVAVEFVGITKLGATRWLPIPFLNTTIQPSELIKPVFILMLGYLIHHKPPPRGGYNFIHFCYFSFYILLPFLLIAKEPDLGTAMVLLLVGYGILFIVGVNWKIWASIFIIIGFLLLIKGADFLVKGGSNIAKRFHIPEIVIGLTIVSIGTSMPELFISVTSALNGYSDMAIGNVIGSNLSNLLLILGTCAIIKNLKFNS